MSLLSANVSAPNFLKKLGLTLSLTTGAAAVMLLILGVSVSRLKASARAESHTNRVLAVSGAVLSSLKDISNGQRGYIITKDKAFLEPYSTGTASIEIQLADLAELISDNPNQIVRVQSLYDISDLYIKEVNDVILLINESKQEEAIEVVKSGRLKRLLDEARKSVANIQSEERQLLIARERETNTFILFSYCSVVGLGFVVGMFQLHAYQLSSREISLREEAEKRAKEVAERNQQLASRLQFQLATASDEVSDLIESGAKRDKLLEMLKISAASEPKD